MSSINPYQILGISSQSSISEIKEAYKKLALIHHPDKGGNPDNFKLLKKCYKYVSTVKKNENSKINTIDDFNNTMNKIK